MITMNFKAAIGFGLSCLLSGLVSVPATHAQEAELGSVADLLTVESQDTEQVEETLPTKISLTEDRQFQGVIVDAQGEPINGSLNMLQDGVTVHATESDSSGVFMIPNVEPGLYQLASVAQDQVGNQLVDISYQTGGEYLPQAEMVVYPVDDGITLEGSCNQCSSGAGQEIVYADSCSGGCGGGFAGGGFAGGGANSTVFSGGANSSAFGGGGGRLFGGGAFSRPGRLLLFGGIATAIAVGTSSNDDDDTTPATPGS